MQTPEFAEVKGFLELVRVITVFETVLKRKENVIRRFHEDEKHISRRS